MTVLGALPPQPDDVAWPTTEWPTGTAPDAVEGLLDDLFSEHADDRFGHTHAVCVVHRGRLVSERYGTWFVSELEAPEKQRSGPVTTEDVHLSWSMAKSVLHAVIGVLANQGRLVVADRAPVPQWSDPSDRRHAITWDQLLHMRPGLQWAEEYYDFDAEALPDVVEMLYGKGREDMAAFAAGFPLVTEPGTDDAYTYSSGTSNIVAAAAQRVIGGGENGMRSFLAGELFGPVGMGSARPDFDDAGTFVASSYLHATARDYARFGLLYLRDGVWAGQRLLPEGWVDHGRAPVSPDDGTFHGAHWWCLGDELGTFYASGFEGQRIVCVPQLDLVVVRLGKTHIDLAPALHRHLREVIAAFT